MFLILAWTNCAWVKPYLPDDKKEPASQQEHLEFVVLKVDGQRKVILNGEEIAVIYGSRLEVEDAVLRKSSDHAESVNVVGYTHGGWPPDEDRTRQIDTAADLKTEWSESGAGQVYAITAATKKVLHGSVYFRLIRPELRYAEVMVNGKKHVMRDGQSLNLNASDKIKVLKVETNLESSEDVVFQVMKVGDNKTSGFLGSHGSELTHELRFRRGDYVFARIPLKVTQ